MFELSELIRKASRSLLVAALGVASIGATDLNAAAPPPAQSSWEKVACPFDISKALLPVECGRLRVPENYDDPGRSIEIAFMIIRPQRNRDPENPVIFLSGGPGSASLVYAEMLVANPQIHDIVADRDWVFFDQRGNGRSTPMLICPEEKDYLKRVKLCRDKLIGEGIDLSQYNSERSARDIEELRKALGVKQWNLWGLSYGSRLAFAVARDFPASVRSIIHDAPSYPGGPEIIDDFRGADLAINRLLSKCAADAACSRRYPDLRTRFFEALQRLRRQPILVGEKRYDDTRLANVIRIYLFNSAPAIYEQRVQSLLAYMDAAARGDGDLLLQIERNMPTEADPYEEKPVPSEGWYAMGQNLSVECNEERSFESPEDYSEAAAESDVARALFALFGEDFGAEFQVCANWPSGRADPIRKSRVYYDGPQLVFSGELDASLSGLSGYTIAMLFPNARNVVFKNGPHGQVHLTDYPPKVADGYRLCALRLARGFLADPTRSLDTRCAESSKLKFVQ